MPMPSAKARALLDSYIESLINLSDGLTIDEFRVTAIIRAQRAALRVRRLVQTLNATFMCLVLLILICAPLVGQIDVPFLRVSAGQFTLFFGALWALALGGLGAVASIYLHVLKVRVQEALRTTDEFEVKGRIFLGCLFSTVLAITLTGPELDAFFRTLIEAPAKVADTIPKGQGGIKLLMPFLAGYSLPLVLKLLEKSIQAIELTLGLDDPKAIVRQLGRRLARRSPN
jgi:hypothetical protein